MVYGFYDGDGIDAELGGYHLETIPRKRIDPRQTPILLECSIIGMMLQGIKMSQGREPFGNLPYFWQQLEKLVHSLKLDQSSFQPRILAVGPSFSGYSNDSLRIAYKWPAIAKRVPEDHRQHRLINIITNQEPWTDKQWEDRATNLQEDLQQMVDCVMNDDTIPAGIETYLMYECGFVRSLPKVASSWNCIKEPFYNSMDRLILPPSVYTPAKYIDQASVHTPAKYIDQDGVDYDEITTGPVYAKYSRWLPQLLAVETKTGEPSGVTLLYMS
ncbi:hypothetical protein BJ875DRAFT_546048 [Amylocarpus encephaloides]|uniref:Uncharacterized protein n=1 Tax=Amylocarpus encephaloides TaxID=45428 RepID=A0A9P7YB05_9HELO|nr:hypothetical protein BJ875DRAFT_546048 [Amylocarpus encephaloides]